MPPRQPILEKVMDQLRKYAVRYIILAAVFAFGILVAHRQWFPYSVYLDIRAFMAGSEDDDTSFVEKLISDSGGVPRRFITPYAPADRTGLQETPIAGLNARRAQPLMLLSKDAPRGYRVIFGAFDFVETLWGAILIDPEGKIVNTWRLSTDDLPLNTEPAFRKNMYGVDIMRDGSVIFIMHEAGGGIVKVDYCGRKTWSIDGNYHHTMTLTEDGNFWTFEGMQTDFDHVLALFNATSGELVRRIDMKDVRAANPDTHIFWLQPGKKLLDAVHGNDIEPLPKELAADFPQFSAGDLLISYKMVNLVFVLDPSTLKIKWWRIGPWNRQHDADWNKGGYISIFSNNQAADIKFSNIVTITPENFESRIPVKGAEYNLFSSFNGMHQITAAATTLITSSRQGRVVEVNADGQVVFEFVNQFDPAAGTALHLSNARFLETGYFEFDEPPVCHKP